MLILCTFSTIFGQKVEGDISPTSLNALAERIGNFSIELLYHTTNTQTSKNVIISPITVWTSLALMAEGASGYTLLQINNVLRMTTQYRRSNQEYIHNIYRRLQVNTSSVELIKVSAASVQNNILLLRDFKELAESVYETAIFPLNFSNTEEAASELNDATSLMTRGKLRNIIAEKDFLDSLMIMTSGAYFKGQWSSPHSIMKMPFLSNTGVVIGEVNMMYTRGTYYVAYINELKARIIEMTYGKEKSLSLIIMLSNKGHSLHDMFRNFAKITLNKMLQQLRTTKQFDEVDCLIPRLKIDSNLDLTNVLINNLGILYLFNKTKAQLPYLARSPLYLSKFIHKTVIDVAEEDKDIVFDENYTYNVGHFKADRPFSFMIIEKETNVIVFGGIYEIPDILILN